MAKRQVLMAALALLVLAGGLPRSATAEDAAVACACDPQAGTLVIRYTDDLQATRPPWPAQPAPVTFYSLLDIERSQVMGWRSLTVPCQLKTDRFEITLEPIIGNVNLLGRCGAAITGMVTVKRNGQVVLRELEFEGADCHQRERMLERIIFRDTVPEPELIYVGYGGQ